MAITFAELINSADLFDRAALMPRPGRVRPGPGDHAVVLDQVEGCALIHPQLPATPAWTYAGLLPGPVLEVRARQTVEAVHRNRIAGTLPYRHVVVDEAAGGSMNDPGSEGESVAEEDVHEAMAAAELNAYTVVHLHGGPTAPDSDGWAENVIGPGGEREDEYEFARETWSMTDHDGVVSHFRSGAAPAYWYHDHAMAATRFNVYAGLAGAWLVRDPLERRLGLPTGTRREIPLVLADRNLDTADGTATGLLNGRLLHKVQVGVRECFAPVNLVNGLAWPRCRVSPQVHRLRLLNGANARFYRLHFLGMRTTDDPQPTPLPSRMVQQIGTDGGLLGAAVDLPGDGLVLAPGERADVLVDFGLAAAAGYRYVAVYNSAAAPFNGAPLGSPAEVTTPDPDGFRTVPQLMRFDLRGGAPEAGLGGRAIRHLPLDPEFRRVPTDHHAMPHDHGHSVIALREEDIVLRGPDGQPLLNPDGTVRTQLMLFLHELQPEDVANRSGCNLHDSLVDGVDAAGNLAKVPAGVALEFADRPGVRWVTVGKRFGDSSMTQVIQGSWHLWRVVNLSPDTHPFHIHLTQFQLTARATLPVLGGPVSPASDTFTFAAPVPGVLDANETGWKDTARVNPGERTVDDDIVSAEVVTLLGCFARHAGLYMYHCHILEHEDVEMMRPFTVVPSDLAALMGGHGAH